jgi:outer membrane cobalamin receptor
MKTLLLPARRVRLGLLAALAMGLCLAIPTASAADSTVTKTPQAKKAKVKAEKPKKQKTKRIVITGSHLPQEIEPGKRKVTAVPVDIITSDQIRRMGAVSVPFVLSRQTGFR